MRFIETERANLTGKVVDSHTISYESPGLTSLLAGRYVPNVETTYRIDVEDGGTLFLTEGRVSILTPLNPNSVALQNPVVVERVTKRLFGRIPVATSYQLKRDETK